MESASQILRDVRSYARGQRSFTELGSYPVYLYMTDGEMLCPACARTEYRQISDATRNGFHNGWAAFGLSVYWEGPTCYCAQCGDPQ